MSLRRASKYRHDFGLLWIQRRETPVIVSVQDDHLPHPELILAHLRIEYAGDTVTRSIRKWTLPPNSTCSYTWGDIFDFFGLVKV